MCGITGCFYFDSAPIDLKERLFRATRLLAHRGPDEEGYYIDHCAGMGSRRLAIIDLLTGIQPIYNEARTVAAVHNGEFYNYQSHRAYLERIGHEFTTHSDTEVVVHLFEEFGEAAFSRLDGMFATAIYDIPNQRLVLVRDFCGIKPLYYKLDRNHLVFASEVKSILAFENSKGVLDETSLIDYMLFQFVLDDRTLFRSIRKLLPGHYLTCDKDGVQVRQYWKPPRGVHQVSIAEGRAQYRENLRSTLALQLRSDVAIGFHLSGGLDTATLVTLAQSSIEPPLLTFSSGFHEGGVFDEQSIAERYSASLGTIHQSIYLSSTDFFHELPAVIWHMDEPAGDAGVVPQFITNKKASQQVKVIITGLGADEVLSGYARHLLYYLAFALSDSIHGTHYCGLQLRDIQKGLRFLSSYEDMLQRYFSSGLVFGSPFDQYLYFIVRVKNARELLNKKMLDVIQDYDPVSSLRTDFEASFDSDYGTDVLDYALWMDFRYMLPPLLQMEDRASMAHSIEARVPLLGKELVELAFSLPSKVKLHNGIPKSLLREVMREMLPGYVVDRQEKVGRPTPFNLWVNSGKDTPVHQLLLSDRCLGRGIFDPQKVRDLVHAKRPMFDRTLWALLNIELWHRLFVDRFVVSPTEAEI